MVAWVQVSEASGMKSTVTTIRAGCCAWLLHSPASLPAPCFINGVQPTNPIGRNTNIMFFFFFNSVRHKAEIQASCPSHPTIRSKRIYRKTLQNNSPLLLLNRGVWFQPQAARVSTFLRFVFTFASFCGAVWVGPLQGPLGGGLLTRASSLLHNTAASGAEEEQSLDWKLACRSLEELRNGYHKCRRASQTKGRRDRQQKWKFKKKKDADSCI